MWRNIFLAFGALIALYLIWNAVQFVLGIIKDRRSKGFALDRTLVEHDDLVNFPGGPALSNHCCLRALLPRLLPAYPLYPARSRQVGPSPGGARDDLFYDPEHRRIYVSCGEGFIDVIEQRDADHYQSAMRIPTVNGARTSTYSVRLNSFFLGIPRRGDEPAEIRVFKSIQ